MARSFYGPQRKCPVSHPNYAAEPRSAFVSNLAEILLTGIVPSAAALIDKNGPLFG
jgi:hypothetical protein